MLTTFNVEIVMQRLPFLFQMVNWCSYRSSSKRTTECTKLPVEVQKATRAHKPGCPSISRRRVMHQFNKLELKWRPNIRPWHDLVYSMDLGHDVQVL